jgi:hypothetical protein
VCLLPRVSMIKHKNNNVTMHVRILNYNQPLESRVLPRRKLNMKKVFPNYTLNGKAGKVITGGWGEKS